MLEIEVDRFPSGQAVHWSELEDNWQKIKDAIEALQAGGGGGGAPSDAEYLTGLANAALTAERVVTDTATVAWDLTIPGQAKASVPGGAFETAGAVAAHVAAADPHTQYQKESEKSVANGYASLDAGGVVPDAQIPAAIARDTEVTAAISASEAGQVRDGDAASGDLAGTYPSPTVTQARGLRETGVPTTLSMGAVADGEFLKRSGAAIIGGTPAGGAMALTIVEKDLGAGLSSGTFDITGSGLTAGKPVFIQQAAAPYTDKGDLDDEAEMGQVSVTGYVFSATVIRCHWNAEPSAMAGNVKFQYAVGA